MDATSPNRDKRRKTVLLRGLLIVAVGGLLLDAGAGSSGLAAVALLLSFALSDLLLLFAPLRLVSTTRFELMVGAADVALVALGVNLAGAAAGALPVSCLLMVLVVALGNYRAHAVAGCTVVGSLHAWLVLSRGTGPDIGRQLALQTAFLCSVGLYYGFLTDGIHRLRRKEEAETLERRELTTLLEILDTITSSLDPRQVIRAIVTKLASIVPAVRCSILCIDEATARCYVLASHDDPDVEMLEVNLERYPEIIHAIRTRSLVFIRDVSSDPLLAQVRDRLQGLDFHSILVIPLTFGEDILGTLCLKSARSEQEFSEREIKFCTAVARASANALKNALSHRRALEESSRHQGTSEKLASILAHSPELILTTDTGGRIAEFNRGAERLLGYRKEDLLGRPFGVLFGSDQDADIVERIRSAGTVANHACRLQRKDGAELEMELNMSVLKNEAEEWTGTVWLGRDVTGLKAAQLQLLQAERLSTIGQVIAGVAHELNNPLSAVLGFSQLLMARHGQSPLARELEKISESALRCQKIVKNLLSFARMHKPERKYLGVNGIIEKTLDLKKYQLHVNNVELRTELDPDLPPTMLDFHQMQQVFLNLINNAEQAMGAARERRGRLLVRTSHREDILRVEVTDNGEGMDPETLQRIFDPFFTTKEQGQGTGLGLSVSYGIVKEHGGRIDARSRRGEGSSFVVELPIWKEKDRQVDRIAYPRKTLPCRSPQRHILVVDDEPLVVDLLIDILEDAGHRVDSAANGSEALRKVREKGYDLIITDVRMPQMNGMELYRELLSVRREMEGRILFITGDVVERKTVEFLRVTRAPTIAKPLDIHVVLEAVEATLGAREEPVGA